MKKVIIALMLIIAGCASSITPANYYQMDYSSAANGEIVSGSEYIWVAPVKVADFLNSTGIVYQINDVEYAYASNNLWAVSLQEQLRQQLAGKLREQLPNRVIMTDKPSGMPKATVTVNVYKFNGRHDGKAIVGGEWLIQRNGSKEVLIKQFEHVIEQKEDGYASLVRALQEGWDAEAVKIANELK